MIKGKSGRMRVREEEMENAIIESQNLDLNTDPVEEDPMHPLFIFPPKFLRKLHKKWKDCEIAGKINWL